MSDDIVNRLREGTNDGLRAWDWMREAANEIEERERVENEKIEKIALAVERG